MKMSNIKAKNYIDHLTAHGEIAFTKQKMLEEMGLTAKAAERAIYRLKRKNEIVSVSKGYYLILTPEFRKLGCLPPDYFIDDLMKHWQQNYYVGLLSAALYFGAAHQQPQIFQVVTDQYRPTLTCGHIKIEFVTKKLILAMTVTQLKTHTGSMNISTPEATMMDLCMFMRRGGGVSHVATVLDELSESIELSALLKLLNESGEHTWKQRLGYLLEYLGHNELSGGIYQQIKDHTTYSVPLVPYYTMSGTKRDAKWHIAINATVESDIDGTNYCNKTLASAGALDLPITSGTRPGSEPSVSCVISK